jgi:hypothetical protein
MYSIVIPHLSNSKYIDTCIKYIKENSKYDPEIIQIIDETDVYYAFNKGVYQAKYDIVVLLSDDMIVSKNWDEVFPMYLAEDTFLTMNVVEPYPGKMNGPECIEYDCGDNLENFDYDKFQNYVDVNKAYVPEIEFNKIGWYMPFVVHKKSFVSYPNIDKFPLYANDVTLFHSVLPNLGYKFALVNSFVYHFQRKSTKQLYSENIMKKRAIFTYSNHQIEDKISYLQKQMIGKFNKNKLCKYEYLHYKKPDGEMTPDQVIEYGLEKLFYEDNYHTILMLDIDCVPLSEHALDYTFQRAEEGVLIGNVQRSNHLDNGKHIYPAPSCIALTRDMYEKLGKPSWKPNARSDIGEELCYEAEKQGIEIEMYMPGKYEEIPYWNTGERKPWDLRDGDPQFGIGTTFVDKDGNEMFYHLFQSRLNVFNHLFFLKCASVML